MASSSQQVIVKVDGQEFLVEVGDLNNTPVKAVIEGRSYEVVIGGRPEAGSQFQAADKPQTADTKSGKSQPADSVTSVTAPMPGSITSVKVRPGQEVDVGDPLCVLDAMKMANLIYSPRAGRIASVEVSEGQAVDYGATLVTFG